MKFSWWHSFTRGGRVKQLWRELYIFQQHTTATAFFVTINLLIYTPVIILLVFLLDWLYTSGYIPWDHWRILYTLLFLYVSSILLHVLADNLFGLTYREITNDLNIQEATPGHPELAWFQQAFDQIRKQFLRWTPSVGQPEGAVKL